MSAGEIKPFNTEFEYKLVLARLDAAIRFVESAHDMQRNNVRGEYDRQAYSDACQLLKMHFKGAL